MTSTKACHYRGAVESTLGTNDSKTRHGVLFGFVCCGTRRLRRSCAATDDCALQMKRVLQTYEDVRIDSQLGSIEVLIKGNQCLNRKPETVQGPAWYQRVDADAPV